MRWTDRFEKSGPYIIFFTDYTDYSDYQMNNINCYQHFTR